MSTPDVSEAWKIAAKQGCSAHTGSGHLSHVTCWLGPKPVGQSQYFTEHFKLPAGATTKAVFAVPHGLRLLVAAEVDSDGAGETNQLFLLKWAAIAGKWQVEWMSEPFAGKAIISAAAHKAKVAALVETGSGWPAVFVYSGDDGMMIVGAPEAELTAVWVDAAGTVTATGPSGASYTLDGAEWAAGATPPGPDDVIRCVCDTCKRFRDIVDGMGVMEPTTLAAAIGQIPCPVNMAITFHPADMCGVLQGQALWKNLTSLDVARNPKFDDRALVEVGRACTSLCDLDACSTPITESGLRNFGGSHRLVALAAGGGSMLQTSLLAALCAAGRWPRLAQCHLLGVREETADPGLEGWWRHFCRTLGAKLKILQMENFWITEDMLYGLLWCTGLVELEMIGAAFLDFLRPDREPVLPGVICGMRSLKKLTARAVADPEAPDDFGAEEAFVTLVRAKERKYGVVAPREVRFDYCRRSSSGPGPSKAGSS